MAMLHILSVVTMFAFSDSLQWKVLRHSKTKEKLSMRNQPLRWYAPNTMSTATDSALMVKISKSYKMPLRLIWILTLFSLWRESLLSASSSNSHKNQIRNHLQTMNVPKNWRKQSKTIKKMKMIRKMFRSKRLKLEKREALGRSVR